MVKWAICVAKYRYDDSQGSATRSVISYFSNVKQLMTKRGEKNHDFIVHAQFTSNPLRCLIVQPVCCLNQTMLPVFHTAPYLVSRSLLCQIFQYTCNIIQTTAEFITATVTHYSLPSSLHVQSMSLFYFSCFCSSPCSILPHSPPLTIQVPHMRSPLVQGNFFPSQCSLFLGSGSWFG